VINVKIAASFIDDFNNNSRNQWFNKKIVNPTNLRILGKLLVLKFAVTRPLLQTISVMGVLDQQDKDAPTPPPRAGSAGSRV
jgi:hypothetical protein